MNTLAGCDEAKDIVVVLQISATLCQNDPTFDTNKHSCYHLKRLLSLITEILSPLDLQTSQVALITFADNAKVEFNFNGY